MKRYVLIVAGGKGLRMGGELPKQFIPFEGKPVLMHTLEAFHRWDASAALVLVLPASHRAYWEMLCREIGCQAPHRLPKEAPPGSSPYVTAWPCSMKKSKAPRPTKKY